MYILFYFLITVRKEKKTRASIKSTPCTHIYIISYVYSYFIIYKFLYVYFNIYIENKYTLSILNIKYSNFTWK